MYTELIKTLLAEFHEKTNHFHTLVSREARFQKVDNKILAVIGMRRTGKTHFVYQHIQALLAKDVPLERILYINFEDDRLQPMDVKKLGALIDSFYSVYPDNHQALCYLFLDEIQVVEDWAIAVRRFFDTKKIRIVLSGSSSKLLSSEIATSLRGRSLSTEIWPFSFPEFLKAKQYASFKKPIGQAARDRLKKYFLIYLNQGGFPEVLNYEDATRIDTLQEYVNVVIFKDIIERHQITNLQLIRYLIQLLLRNVGAPLSVNKLFNDLKSQGFSVAKTTIHEYLSYIEDAYLSFSVPLYAKSIRKVQTNPKKIYAIDTGLVNAYHLKTECDLGHLFENFIFLNLKRQKHKVYYYLTKERYEIDFLTQSQDGKLHLYQVCWDMSDEKTVAREKRALEAAEKELGVSGKLITPENYLTEILNGY